MILAMILILLINNNKIIEQYNHMLTRLPPVLVMDFSCESVDAAQQYGPHNRSRSLEDEDQVWEHNCWDNTVWTEEMEAEAESKVEIQRMNSILYQRKLGNAERVKELEEAQEALQKSKKWLRTNPQAEDLNESAKKWDVFYNNHERWFFKDRQWLRGEFRELFYDTEFACPDGTIVAFPAAVRIMEVGCGAGNTVFPIWKERKGDPTLQHIFACDFSPKAVDLVKSFRDFSPDKMTAFVHDLSSNVPFAEESIVEGSLDAITAIFVLSALKPASLLGAFSKLHSSLRPGGLLLFRDYARYDLTQLRLKPNRLIDDDFYFRGDGTSVYFFTEAKLRELAEAAGFVVIECRIDRRIITNRQRKIKMYRNWIQAKFMKKLI
jgi:tRNAThr (cytosine32-N3)-methyltransferase